MNISNTSFFRKNSKAIIFISVLLVVAIIFGLKPWQVKPKKVTAVRVNDLQALAPASSTDGQDIFYYDLKEKALYEYNLSSAKKTQLSDTIANQPLDLIWSPDRSQVIIKTVFNQVPDIVPADSEASGQTTVLWNYNIATKKYSVLSTNIDNPAPNAPLNPVWTADSKKIIYYLEQDYTPTNLVISNPDGTGTQTIGKAPQDIYSILTLNITGNILYYSSFSTGTALYNVSEFDIKNQTSNQLLADSGLALPLNDHQIIADDGKNSFIFDLNNNSRIALPILIPDAKSALSPDGTEIVASILDQKDKNIEKFSVVDLSSQKLIKILDPGLNSTNYLNLILDHNDNIFFVNNSNFYEIKN